MSRRIPREEVANMLRARARQLKRRAKRIKWLLECNQTMPLGTCMCDRPATHIGLNDALYCDACLAAQVIRPIHLVKL